MQGDINIREDSNVVFVATIKCRQNISEQRKASWGIEVAKIKDRPLERRSVGQPRVSRARVRPCRACACADLPKMVQIEKKAPRVPMTAIAKSEIHTIVVIFSFWSLWLGRRDGEWRGLGQSTAA